MSSRPAAADSSSGALATKMSCSVTTSDSIRWTSVTAVMRREPSTSRLIWTSRSNALEVCSRIARSGRSTPAVRTRVSRRDRASRGEFAWIVVSEPSWPVFIAWSMSRVSGPRTSPTMIRSGLMRSALRTSSRIRTSPEPSMFGGLDSSVITCSCWSWSSAASSIVTMRSSPGTNADIAFSSVVLPVPVPPEMRMLSLPLTHDARNCAALGEIDPKLIRSSIVYGSRANLRIVSVGPRSASGGMIALTRLPSGRRASTIGEDSSTRRPTCDTILSMMRRRWALSANVDCVRSIRPERSM